MKPKNVTAVAILCALMLLSWTASGDNPKSFSQLTTSSGRVYQSVQVLKVNPDGLLIQYAPSPGGIAVEKVAFDDLPAVIQKQYNYNTNAASAYVKKQEDDRKRDFAEKLATGLKHNQFVLEQSNILVQIVQFYHTNHVYIGQDTGYSQNVYVCGDMSCDVWDMVSRQGIHAVIAVGNISGWTERVPPNHAWVLAEIDPDNMLALETTGGYVVPLSQNPNYYHPDFFLRSPRHFHAAMSMIQQYVNTRIRAVDAQHEYNDVLTQYKGGDNDMAVKVRLIQQKAVIDNLDAQCSDITNRLANIVD